MNGTKMTTGEAVEKLDALTDYDPEEAHGEADKILLGFVPEDVRAAYARAVGRVGFWYS